MRGSVFNISLDSVQVFSYRNALQSAKLHTNTQTDTMDIEQQGEKPELAREHSTAASTNTNNNNP